MFPVAGAAAISDAQSGEFFGRHRSAAEAVARLGCCAYHIAPPKLRAIEKVNELRALTPEKSGAPNPEPSPGILSQEPDKWQLGESVWGCSG